MRMYDIIVNKRNGIELTNQEIKYVVECYTNGTIPDYQVAALLMAIYFKGLNKRETATLTQAMAVSGDMVDLSEISGIKVDKHSTGGVGDKTTLIVAPIVAACGVPVAKMSGRGLGYTGGTVDKLEAFPGYKTNISQVDFINIVKTIGISIIGQTGNIAPADKKLYALRDVTGTVENMSLIAASIMSKKLAAGADAIVLDVKTGSGAFMKILDDSIELARIMVDIGVANGKQVVALITNMDAPLGRAVGNNLELVEAIETLSGRGTKALTDISIELAANMLALALKGNIGQCRELAHNAIYSGTGLDKLRELVMAQGGDVEYIDDTDKFPTAHCIHPVISKDDGYVHAINSEQCGICSVTLGAGRNVKEDVIDFSAGVLFYKTVGDMVHKGDLLATIYTDTTKRANEVEPVLLRAITIEKTCPKELPLIYARVTKDSVEKFEM